VTSAPAVSEAPIPPGVEELARAAARTAGGLPAYVWDLAGLAAHAAAIRAAVPAAVELFYAAKANPDPGVLATLAGPGCASRPQPFDGVEVASGGELAHVRAALPAARLAFGGPGKTPEELAAALAAGVERVHVESTHELRVLAAAAERLGRRADVLLRANPPWGPSAGPGPAEGAVLAMGGAPSPFGMDPAGLAACLDILTGSPGLRLRGLHVHLTSGPGAGPLAALAADVLAWGLGWAASAGVAVAEVNLGGGMGVDYGDPAARFDWPAYGAALARLAAAHPGVQLRIEPGRAVTVYDGYYVTRVLDVKDSHGESFAVLAGGTHHLRTPAAKGHDQPFAVLGVPEWAWPWPRPEVRGRRVTLVGQLCTPKDVLARRVPVARLRAGDVVVFAMAGAYGWNISHRDFLMHDPPAFHRWPAH
jgi:diaminopimelate decarboxylase